MLLRREDCVSKREETVEKRKSLQLSRESLGRKREGDVKRREWQSVYQERVISKKVQELETKEKEIARKEEELEDKFWDGVVASGWHVRFGCIAMQCFVCAEMDDSGVLEPEVVDGEMSEAEEGASAAATK